MDYGNTSAVFKRFLVICFVLWQSPLFAQQSDSIFNKYADRSQTTTVTHFTIVITDSQCFGVHPSLVVRQWNNHTFIQKGAGGSKCILRSAPANDSWKFSPALEIKAAQLHQFKKKISFIISADDIDALLANLQHKNIKHTVVSLYRPARSAIIICAATDFFTQVIKDPLLTFADLYLEPATDAMISGYDRSLNAINLADRVFPGANGKDITIGIRENQMDEADIDLQKRIVPSPIAATQKDFHATSMATLAGGAGNSFYTGKGAAWKCSFFSSSFVNLFPDDAAVLQQRNVTVQNHSYGTQVQSFYGAEAVAYDQQCAAQPGLLHIFSSGNRGTESATTGSYAGITGFANITGNFKSGKNIVTVAAVDSGGIIAPFSSAGPLYDGRLAPQLAALGPNGTSDAAALVSGATAVLQQVYKDSNNQILPAAALLKSILFASAEDMYNKAIDYRSGFGLLNLHRAIRCLQQRMYDGSEVQQSQIWSRQLNLPANAANLRILLTWTDTAAQPNNNRALVNDLDLELTNVSTGIVYKPWVLSAFPNADSLNKLPVRKTDSLNTAEMISIDLPAAGTYQLTVKGSRIQTTRQNFFIAYTWDTLNTIQFTAPVHPGDIGSHENGAYTIRWRAPVADPNTTGILSLSTDNGASWQVLSNVRLSDGKFRWSIPAVTAIAQLKLESSNVTGLSHKFLINPLTKIKVDYLCADSLRLSWQKTAFPSSYRLYVLGYAPFIAPLMDVADTFIVLNRSLYPENVYAVQPVLSNGPEAPRSVAVDVRTQGVACYYNAFVAEDSGSGIALNLLLSFTGSADSIQFQKVSASGVVLRHLSTTDVAGGLFDYSSFDDAPFTGPNYYRAVIWIDGRQVLTGIEYVIHNGMMTVLVYPNPVMRHGMITFSIQTAIGDGWLQIIDVSGKVVQTLPANGSLMVSAGGLPAGMYYYRLVPASGKVVTGKFIIK